MQKFSYLGASEKYPALKLILPRGIFDFTPPFDEFYPALFFSSTLLWYERDVTVVCNVLINNLLS